MGREVGGRAGKVLVLGVCGKVNGRKMWLWRDVKKESKESVKKRDKDKRVNEEMMKI